MRSEAAFVMCQLVWYLKLFSKRPHPAMLTNNFSPISLTTVCNTLFTYSRGEIREEKNPVNCTSVYRSATMRLSGSSLISCHASISSFDDEKCSAALFLRWIFLKKRVPIRPPSQYSTPTSRRRHHIKTKHR